MGDRSTPVRRSGRHKEASQPGGGSGTDVAADEAGGSDDQEDTPPKADDPVVAQLRRDFVGLRSAAEDAARASAEATRLAAAQRKDDLAEYRAERAAETKAAAADQAAFHERTARAAAAAHEAFRQQMLAMMTHQGTATGTSPAVRDRNTRDGRSGLRLGGPGPHAHTPGCGGFAGEAFILSLIHI